MNKRPFSTPIRVLLTVFGLSFAVWSQVDPGTANKPPAGTLHKAISPIKGDAPAPLNTASTPATGNGINYYGGPVLHGTVNVYFIWYGNWGGTTGSHAMTVLQNLASSIGGSPYFNINTTYSDTTGTSVSNSVTFSGSTTDNYSQGTSFGDNGVQAIVTAAITSGRLPSDTNGVYFVLTSADVNETSGFCTQYCGWHTNGTIAGSDIKFAFIGNSNRCPAACAAQSSSPNGDAGVDGMASVISHELEESATDPDLNAWYDSSGAENADKCAWTFSPTYFAPNGSFANMNLNGLDYLIQRNWVNASGGYCSLA